MDPNLESAFLSEMRGFLSWALIWRARFYRKCEDSYRGPESGERVSIGNARIPIVDPNLESAFLSEMRGFLSWTLIWRARFYRKCEDSYRGPESGEHVSIGNARIPIVDPNLESAFLSEMRGFLSWALIWRARFYRKCEDSYRGP